jgi:histidinol-phosphatase (PHP family)
MIAEDFGGDARKLVEKYYDAVCKMVGEGGFDILGHPDIVRKYNKDNVYFDTGSKWYMQCIVTLADIIAADKSFVVEVNTGGMNRGCTTDCYPSLEFLKLLHERQVSVTITGDAHKIAHLGGHYDVARYEIIKAGYESCVVLDIDSKGKILKTEESLYGNI